MTTLVAQIAPQRSTQYAELARQLAPYELQLSPLGPHLTRLEVIDLAGLPYLRFELPAAPDAAQLYELGALAMTSAFFDYYDRIGEMNGPFLAPLATTFPYAQPFELPVARRYRGKTNELLTQFLCNLARFSSELADRPWSTLRVFDPLSGGGTTLFTALALGADVAGVEQDQQDVTSSVSYLTQFMRESGTACSVKEERLKKLGRRWSFSISAVGADGKQRPQHCTMVHGDTSHSSALLGGFHPDLIVTDLPYGIQHHGALDALLTRALPVWTEMLPPDGALAFAWDATRFDRPTMVELVGGLGVLDVCDEPVYRELAHRVDRVIKRRDLLVARPLRRR